MDPIRRWEEQIRMKHFVRRPWDLPQKLHTPEDVYRDRKLHRRRFLKAMGITGVAAALGGCSEEATDEEIEKAGKADPLPKELANVYPAKRNKEFSYGRKETTKRDALEYTNFYEFSPSKDSWKHVGDFKPSPWKLEVTGLCAKPRTFDMDDIYKLFTLEERAYRHRCVETWAMCVPWTGFQLSELLKLVEPKKSAKYVAFETFERPKEAPYQAQSSQYPWPYQEGLTIDEAMNELTLLATGLYGEPMPKQNGAPIRLVVPWKYGFKGAKSIVTIRLIDKLPPTFWTTVNAAEYAFEANVEPDVPHPRWSQKTEWMLGSKLSTFDEGDRYKSVIYNGYGDYVGKLYKS
jgi:sulfoxide reductase catalytic subunit YedY